MAQMLRTHTVKKNYKGGKGERDGEGGIENTVCGPGIRDFHPVFTVRE